ncbi:MAG: peptidoglycan-binding protein [Coleofasciculus sp. Co-bin14]|nr:peptidoglycan-binding protein [Coleofasciculus sp. Co-bin14]
MDTLAYLHLAETYESPDCPELRTAIGYQIILQSLNWTKCRSRAVYPLLFFGIALISLSVSGSALALQKGDSNPEVTSLQKKLAATGYFNGPFTGYYGSLTQEAITKFQQAKGLTVNGIANPETVNALEFSAGQTTPSQSVAPQQGVTNELNASTSSVGTLQKGDSSTQVTSLQKKLATAGYFDGPFTGYYGSLTQEAVKKFQQANGLTASGIADSQTLNTIESNSGTLKPSIASPKQEVTTEPQAENPSNLDKSPNTAPSPQTTTTPQTSNLKQGNPDDSDVSTSSGVSLQKGDSNTQVTSLQKKLAAAGYFNGPFTGYYGSLTQEAVKQFQKANSLSETGIADPQTLTVIESGKGALKPFIAPPKPEVTAQPKTENPSNFEPSQTISPSPQTTTTPQKPNPQAGGTDNSNAENSGTLNKPQAKSPAPQGAMKLKKTISGNISPKSVVYSGNGLFFAQNMMYSHTITVYDREHKLVKTIPDSVNLANYGHSKFKGNYKGAPVEASFSHSGKYAWVSNYQMYGSGFNNPGDDVCSPSQKTDNSFLYRINTDNLKIEKVIQVGSVPKYVATSPDNRLVLVSNWCSWDLSIVDTEKNKQTHRIQLGRYPRGIVVDEDSEKAYVAVMGSYDIAKVDLNDFSVEWLKDVGQSPRHLNIDPAGKYLYASLNGEGRIAKIDLSTGKVLKKAVTGSAPRSMVISDDGQRLYVVNYNSNTVSKVRTSDMKVLQEVKVDSSPIGITYDPETREVWVACYSGSIMVFQD